MDTRQFALDTIADSVSPKRVLERLDSARGQADKSFVDAVIALVAEEDPKATRCLASLVPLLKDRIQLINQTYWSIFIYCHERPTDANKRQTFADIVDTMHELNPACASSLLKDFFSKTSFVL